MEQAARLQPLNAEYRWALGRYRFYGLGDAASAMPYFQKAISLNPSNVHYWLDYANALLNLSRANETREAIQEAIQLDPTTPRTNWEAGNLYLVSGDTVSALHRFRIILDSDANTPEYPVLPLCWRVTKDPDLIIKEALPRRADVHLRFLQLLIAENKAEGAASVWQSFSKLKQSFDPRLVFPYFQYLIGHHDVRGAEEVWNYLTASTNTFQHYSRSDNLVINASFEQPVLNAGFDWLYRESRPVMLAIDGVEYHSGHQSLAIAFNGESTDAGITQLVPVEPNSDYQFSAYVKADRIEGAGGPQFEVRDAYTQRSLLLTDEMTGTFNWRLVDQEFHTGDDTRLVDLRVVRVPGNTLVRGKLWIDDVSVRRK